MLKFAINTLGCKVNQYESQQIRQMLESAGLVLTRSVKSADIIIVNSCCITATASAKSRQYVRQGCKANPKALVILAGCLGSVDTGELINISDNVHIIKNKNQIAEELSAVIKNYQVNKTLNSTNCKNKKPSKPHQSVLKTNNKTREVKASEYQDDFKLFSELPALASYSGQSRAFLKVQDGCDGYCTYCIIPRIRKNVHSKGVGEVLAEARALVESGHKEIVLTGINLGAYGKETVRKKRWEGGKNPAFADLLGKLAGVEGLERIRLSSLEPADVTDDLLEVMSGNENIMPHLHLPLQSGSDAVLKRMCRQYRLGDFMRVVEKIKGAIDRPAITTDIIVGFPGETDEDFERTLEAAREVHFSKIHVFSYSNRKGTPAEKLGRKVKSQVIKSRSQRLNELGRELAESYRGKLGGVEETVLVETVRPARGRCSRYFMVELPGGKTYRKGDVVRTVI